MIDTSEKSHSDSRRSMVDASNAIDLILDSGLQPTDKVHRLTLLLNSDESMFAAAALRIVMEHERTTRHSAS